MKLTLESLPAQLQQRLLPAYLVSGDEPLRVGEAAMLIRARARAAGFSERAVFFIERAGSVWDEAQQAAQSLSLFAQRRTVEIRLPTGKAGVAGGAALQRLVAAAGDDLLLLIDHRQARTRDRRQRVGAGAAGARCLAADLAGGSRPAAAVAAAARTRGAPDAGRGSRNHAGRALRGQSAGGTAGNRQAGAAVAARRPCRRRRSGREQRRQCALRCVPAGPRRCAARDAARALRILGGLQAEGTEPPLVLWALLRELRSLQPGARARAPVARLIARAARADRWPSACSAAAIPGTSSCCWRWNSPACVPCRCCAQRSRLAGQTGA